MRAIVAGCFVGLWMCTVACGQVDGPLAPQTGPDEAEAVPGEAGPAAEPPVSTQAVPVAAAQPAAATASSPASAATRPAALRIGGLPARQWLNIPAPVQSHNLEGRLWVVGVLEPWSERSRKAAAELAGVAREWSTRGVEVLLVTVAPVEEVSRYPELASLALPIGTGSQLPVLVPLEPLPAVYLVGPDYTVVWTGPVERLAGALGRYEPLAPGGLTQGRENELTNRLNRAEAAFNPNEPFTVPASADKYFIATGLASTVADAAPAGHPLHRRAVELLAKLDRQGQRLLENVRDLLAQGRFADAHALLEGIAEAFYGRPPGAQALAMLQDMRKQPRQQAAIQAAQNESSARQAVQMGQQALGRKRYVDAQRYLQMAVDVYPRTQAAERARQMLSDLRRDKAAASQIAEQKAEPEAPVLLGLAARYAAMGQSDVARQYYQQVLRLAPGTAYAKQAQEGLALLPVQAASQPAK